MGSLYWLQPGWGDACCGRCGVNIKSTGGDPDWGLCYPCMCDHVEAQREPEYRGPVCDICGAGEAVTGTNGYGVCSEYCAIEAAGRPPAKGTP